MATPPFLPGQIPGVTVGQVPGAPAGGAPDPTAQVGEQTKRMLAMLMQAAGKKQMANTAVPSPVPGQEDPSAARQIGMNTANPRAWGTQRFLATLGTNMRNAVSKSKQDQLLKAEGDWSYLQSSMNELYQAQQSGDQQAIAAAQAKVDVTLHDPKKLKNMAKALNQDWLNPEKTTVYGEALKKVTAQGQKTDAAKAQASQGLMGIFKKIMGQKQQLQLTLDEQNRMAEEIQKKAPAVTPGIDKESAAFMREQMKEEAKTKEDERKEAARAKELEEKQTFEKEQTEMKEKFTRQRDEMQNRFHETMETMRETAAEQRQNKTLMAMLEREHLKLNEADKKLFKTDESKISREVTDSVTSLRQQLAQANQSLRSLKTSASNHWLMGPGKDEIKEAEGNVSSLEKAIAHIEKNRDAIMKGKAELGEVIGKAYDIMGGGGGVEVPGFVPDKK